MKVWNFLLKLTGILMLVIGACITTYAYWDKITSFVRRNFSSPKVRYRADPFISESDFVD